jgi:uncharacterized protein YabN with tetrapyrrole methylase and pyrophosphatase domain
VREILDAGASPALEAELGDLLFAVVNLTRLCSGQATRCLQAANAKFTRRFRSLEAIARTRGLSLDALSLAEMDGLWDEVKARERE